MEHSEWVDELAAQLDSMNENSTLKIVLSTPEGYTDRELKLTDVKLEDDEIICTVAYVR